MANPNDVSAERVAEECDRLLTEDERARLLAFRFERHRREYLTTHILVRTALSHYHQTSPEAWRFTLNAYGKPAANGDCGMKFNLSNCPDLVACLISHGAEVGVDVEPKARAMEIAEVAKTVFSPLELEQLEALSESERLDRGVSLWTLKEAYIKARGMGVSLPLKKFSFVFGGADGIQLHLDPCLNDESGRWQFCQLDHAEHRVAVMVERTAGPELEVLEMRPLQAEPIRLSMGGVRWFPDS
jgi:4'-phosphopantetheinyl transferase